MTSFLTRAESGLTASQAHVRSGPAEGVTLHYSTGEELGRPDVAAWWQAIWSHHVETLGYDDIAYHLGVHMATGEIVEGRPLDRIGAHSYGHGGWLGIVLLGDDDPGRDITPAAARSLRWLLRRHLAPYGARLPREPHSVQAARMGRGTACPGAEGRALLNTIGTTMTNVTTVIYADPREWDLIAALPLITAAPQGVVFTADAEVADEYAAAGIPVTTVGGRDTTRLDPIAARTVRGDDAVGTLRAVGAAAGNLPRS